MTIADSYAIPGTPRRWDVPQDYVTCFNWEFAPERTRLLGLYERGKTMQWNATDRIDWSQELDPENPQQLPPEMLPINAAPFFQRMAPREQSEIRRHHQAWGISQFLHGEQGALICAAKIVQQVPDMDAKFYAATQVMDEARHVEVYKKLLEKFGTAYPMTRPLQTLLDQVLQDRRWDMTYLGMQVVIEGLALAAFARIRDHAQNPLAAAVNAYVMEDEARHVAFGRLSLRDYYPQLTQHERDEREEFLVEACYHMRDRFDALGLWESLGLPVEECLRYLQESGVQAAFRSRLFTRIVPTVRDIGLWGEKIRRGYEQMGVLDYAKVDIEAQGAEDERVAREHDARRAHVEEVIRAAE
ncbi:ferritin-like domain-containing protein [Siccirubricoccus sp. G192]|uniref:ferritin-like domain-containing protein n=1 Tax=Siccirubricoccus sp. G192 TaxID=2849651 RepID=UPI001C2B8585|nr:ferritin-like domain-containing protein [Siccirubricoccus sp. G192]MBV1797034.1 ferritin-like domain-containing protein [Siccirubricoccus sp. G192]